MCGIIGYYNFNVKRDLKYILEVLFRGLHRLEYRGYDSAGVCFDACVPDATLDARDTILEESCSLERPVVIKAEGKIDVLEEHAYLSVSNKKIDLSTEYLSHVGIAHTRWATHGPPSPENSHPQVSDPSNEFVVVHNGIITNYKPLKEFLIKHGEVFVSDTDTEVIPKLCKYVYHRLNEKIPFPKLVMEVLKKLEGAYALLIKSIHYPGELVACKRGSPLILGVKEGEGNKRGSFNRLRDYNDRSWKSAAMECWIASDASAVVEYTKKVVVLEDNDVLHVVGAGYGIYNTLQQDVEEAVARDLMELQIEVEEIMKGGYDHYMQKEIHEQPEAIQQTMRGRVQFERPASETSYVSPRIKPGGLVDYIKEKPIDPYTMPRIKLGGLIEYGQTIRLSRRILFIACGTSYHSCLAARQTVEELVEVPVVLELASDLLDRRCPIFRDDTCVFVSQSGETADTLQALEYAKAMGALCVGITNTVGSAISRATHCGVHQNAGYEIGVASTKAYTSQIICITMMALALSEDSISKRPRRDAIIDQLAELPDKVREALSLDDQMKHIAQQLVDESSLLFFARGYNYATALEAALKMKEVALIHSEGILAGEMKHGPLALVDEHLPILVVATRDRMYAKMESILQQLLARGARLMVLCNKGEKELQELKAQGVQLIEVPETVDALQTIINIVPLQLLAYHLTVLRGHNVDQPRNLAKAVTVSEETGEVISRNGSLSAGHKG